jgi:hypothetical protein
MWIINHFGTLFAAAVCIVFLLALVMGWLAGPR